MGSLVIYIAIIIAFYIIGAYATTDILRLLKNGHYFVWESDCYCFLCGERILLRDQFPIIGYVLSHGKCRHCQRRIPFSDLFLEIFLFSSMAGIAVWTGFSWVGFWLCICLYELTKACYLVKAGPREDRFILNILYSVLSNIVVFSLLAFLFLVACLI